MEPTALTELLWKLKSTYIMQCMVFGQWRCCWS